jgi:hypothetical protein
MLGMFTHLAFSSLAFAAYMGYINSAGKHGLQIIIRYLRLLRG